MGLFNHAASLSMKEMAGVNDEGWISENCVSPCT
jgi:hypothetical protein